MISNSCKSAESANFQDSERDSLKGENPKGAEEQHEEKCRNVPAVPERFVITVKEKDGKCLHLLVLRNSDDSGQTFYNSFQKQNPCWTLDTFCKRNHIKQK